MAGLSSTRMAPSGMSCSSADFMLDACDNLCADLGETTTEAVRNYENETDNEIGVFSRG